MTTCLSLSVPCLFKTGIGGILEDAQRENKDSEKGCLDAVGSSSGLALLLTSENTL